MGKKKSSGVKFKTEDEVYEDLKRLISVWKKIEHKICFPKEAI